MAELEAYRRFGERCGQMKYKTFSTILIQNLQKGGHRMADLLEKEALEAWDERKRKARVMGGNSSNKVACSNDHDACGGDGDHHDTCIFVVLWMIV